MTEREDSYIAGTKEGGAKAATTNKAKYGPDFYSKIGAAGGRASGSGGYYHAKYVKDDLEFVRACGRKGGLISRRKKQHAI